MYIFRYISNTFLSNPLKIVDHTWSLLSHFTFPFQLRLYPFYFNKIILLKLSNQNDHLSNSTISKQREYSDLTLLTTPSLNIFPDSRLFLFSSNCPFQSHLSSLLFFIFSVSVWYSFPFWISGWSYSVPWLEI